MIPNSLVQIKSILRMQVKFSSIRANKQGTTKGLWIMPIEGIA